MVAKRIEKKVEAIRRFPLTRKMLERNPEDEAPPVMSPDGSPARIMGDDERQPAKSEAVRPQRKA